MDIVDDLNIYRSAKLLIDLYGPDAILEAALQADELLDAGDLDGQRVWLRIRVAVVELLKFRPEVEASWRRLKWRYGTGLSASDAGRPNFD